MITPTFGAVVHGADLRVLQDRALGDELAVLGADVGDLHADAGVQARGQAGADLEAEQAAAEQRVLVAAGLDRRRHRVDDRLRQALGTLDAVDLAGAELPSWAARSSVMPSPTTIAWHSVPSSPARRAPSDTAPSEFLLNAPS